MTAEVAILNRGAVALAADSAVTVGVGGPGRKKKIYDSANKLMMLSDHAPVGVMFFGNAELMGIPWETLLKDFRRDLGWRSFPSFEGYVLELLGYLKGTVTSRIPSDHQTAALSGVMKSSLREARDGALRASAG